MGYYTDFSLEIKFPDNTGDNNKKNEILTRLEEISDYSWEDMYTMNGKWYEHKNHMKVLSKEYPNILFILSGEGEEAGDMWREYHKNGKFQREDAKIAFDVFDESKMK